MLNSILLLGGLLGFTSVVRGDNPIIQTSFTADPGPLVYGDKVYLFAGHDEGTTSNLMVDWRLYSTGDMANWQDHGPVMSLETFSWAQSQAWAGQVIARNGKFYYYVPVRAKNPNQMMIGVGVSDTVTGPFKDALGHPLVGNDEIDPTVYIDDDGQAYLYWGNPGLYYVKLNTDMISYSGPIVQVDLTTDGFGTRPGNNAERPTTFEEAPWVYKRNGMYYMVFAGICCPEDLRYSTGPSITGPWTYRGLIMSRQSLPNTPIASSNHPGIIDFKGNSYLFYHNAGLPDGGDNHRSIAVERFTYNANGTIPNIPMTKEGPPQIGTLNPYTRQEAETMTWSSGVLTETCSEGGLDVCLINNGDYVKVKGVAFGRGAKSFSARVSSANNGGNIEVRLDSVSGTLVGTCSVPGTGGWQSWTTVSCSINGAKGTHDLYLRFTGNGNDYLFNFNWWSFA